jgi:hypothetical protein
MASRDRFPLEPRLEPVEVTPSSHHQGELFARLALRQLPLMKGTPEDFWVLPDTTPTMH